MEQGEESSKDGDWHHHYCFGKSASRFIYDLKHSETSEHHAASIIAFTTNWQRLCVIITGLNFLPLAMV
jgi:hypothetical protein